MQDLLEPLAEDSKAPGAFKTISETAACLDVPPHVLRFWESRFPQVKPTKMRGGRRYYRPEDIEILSAIKELLYKQGYTIEGARKALEQVKHEKPARPKTVASAAGAQQAQLAVIRQELIALSDLLKSHLH